MAYRHRFEFGLAWRTLVLLAAVWLFATSLSVPDLRAGRIVTAGVAFAALASLWTFIQRTNLQLSRFVDSIRFEDYAQRFSDPSGAGFSDLGDTLDAALKSLQAKRDKSLDEGRYLAAVVDDTPGALVAIDGEGRVELLNKGARMLFASHPIARIEDFDALGPELAAALRLPAGTRKITRLILDGAPHKALLASSHVARVEGSVTMVSILPLQSELGAFELAAQADLVRVLTHEIMNSLTPVTSLARTGAELIASAANDPAKLADAQLAAETVARRSEGILRFVESYREFAQSPQVHRRKFAARPWAEEIMQLALANSEGRKIDSAVEVVPGDLRIEGDPELLAQALLNLMRNSLRAASEQETPLLRLRIEKQRGAICRIEVRDNGPGIPAERREDIFLPFYTTHRGGSGVGLSFARQVALAHGGSIAAGEAKEGGASLALIL